MSDGQGELDPQASVVAVLRRRLATANQLVGRGRIVPGLRMACQAGYALARRQAWTDAADGAVLRGNAWLRRGRPDEALECVAEARLFRVRSGRAREDTDLVALQGEALTDRGRPDDAQTVLKNAWAETRARPEGQSATRMSLALARALFWRGRYADSDGVLMPLLCREETGGRAGSSVPGGAGLTGPDAIRAMCLAARNAVGRGDLGHAAALAADAVARAGPSACADVDARSRWSAAFVALARGDLDEAHRQARAAVDAARRAHDPMQAQRARLLIAEIDRRLGRHGRAARVVGRIRRLGAGRQPTLVGIRCRFLQDLLHDGGEEPQIVARWTGATGLHALALFSSPAAAAARAETVGQVPVHVVEELFGICQVAEEASAIAADLCARVRRRVRATSVACVVAHSDGPRVLACSGPPPTATELGDVRLTAVGVPPRPTSPSGARLPLVIPVAHAGGAVGALLAAWPPGEGASSVQAMSVLAAAAVAVASVVSSARDEHVRRSRDACGGMLGATPAMAELRRVVERAAAAPFVVLVEGESGAGKELVARALHRGGPRRDRTFCTVNCAALPEDLVEAELFGHARGAFTGAATDRTGVFEEAHGGTLFLDEVGELSARAQAKLLRVIQEGELRRVGENTTRRVDVRLVAATNRDLRREVEAGRFRADLLYRLDVIRIVVPPLRERPEDVLALVDHYWRDAAARIGSRAVLAAATVAALARYDWPGNVRELQNVLAALAVRCPGRGVVAPHHLPAYIVAADRDACTLERARRTCEERVVRAALGRAGGRRARAAAELGITRQGLTKLMARLGIGDRASASQHG